MLTVGVHVKIHKCLFSYTHTTYSLTLNPTSCTLLLCLHQQPKRCCYFSSLSAGSDSSSSSTANEGFIVSVMTKVKTVGVKTETNCFCWCRHIQGGGIQEIPKWLASYWSDWLVLYSLFMLAVCRIKNDTEVHVTKCTIIKSIFSLSFNI